MSKTSKGNKLQARTYAISITGNVQGVGFRPAVYRFAEKFNLKGAVSNSGSGVEVEISSDLGTIKKFLQYLTKHLPANASIRTAGIKKIKFKQFDGFSIISSRAGKRIFSTDIPADLSICDKCAKELADKTDRRYRYPFINCTQCGPRFTITKNKYDNVDFWALRRMPG
jgi:hydrogenase maturation protein HypF